MMKRRNEDDECQWCDRVWGVFGVATGALIFLIGMDLLSGGLIGRMVGKPVAARSETSNIEEVEEDYDDEE
jgi:hypothetical protein